MGQAAGEHISSKSYGIAVVLSAVFGSLGLQHFYLGRPLVGLFDVALTTSGIFFLIVDQVLLGISLLLIDGVHWLFVTIQLLIGAAHDGEGAVVAYPGQFAKRR